MSESLSDDDLTMIAALAANASHERAGATVNRSAKTVQRRMSHPAFAAELRVTKAQRLSANTEELESIELLALRAVTQLLDSESEQIRLGAARLTLYASVRYHTTLDLEERLQAVEQRLAAAVKNGRR